MINTTRFSTPEMSKYYLAARMWKEQCRSMSTEDFIKSYEQVKRLHRQAITANRKGKMF